jgi:hypothetical protein
MFKLMFKGLFQCMPYGCVVLWSVQPLPLLSFPPLPATSQFLTAFNAHPYILYIDTICHEILLILCHSLFRSLFLLVALLQTCSTSEFAYDHACFCACLSLDLSSMYERNHGAFCF